MNGATAIGLACLLPLCGAPLVALAGRMPNLRETITLATAVATFAVVCTLAPQVLEGARPSLHLIDIFPGMALVFQVEPLGMLFALVASGLWIVTSMYAIGYMRGHHEEHQTRFFFCFALSIACALGVAFSGNMLTLFFCYEALTLSTYPLVTHHRSEEAKRGGRIYLGILLSTSVGFLLLGMIATYHVAGSLAFIPGGILAGKASDSVLTVLLFLYAFGTGKAALMPFHRWLPAAMVAPTPVSALLHAVAVVKAGVFTIVKVVVYVFGIDFLSGSGLNTYLAYAAALTIVLASLIAMTQDNLKARLAYSTISQLAYIVLGAALANAYGILGAGLHIVTHAFGKITLFFCAGAIMVALHKTEISDMRGIGRQMPFTMGAFAIGTLSIIGLPPLGGSWSKWYLALGAADAGHVALIAVLMLSSLLNIAYLVPIPARAFFGRTDHDAEHDGLHEAPLLCVVPLCLTALGTIALFFAAEPIYDLLAPIVLH
ncbi:MAG: monovalent cation/H+ antiporter subunit D family protein [Candidatus Latescibacteria bacterium]|nr:monovalent cation/H+ antiporter subunit D family protein [Candidatus Latescibacterota bacterium]